MALALAAQFFNLLEKPPRLKSGGENVFVDPTGYQACIADREQAFQAELKKQQSHPQ